MPYARRAMPYARRAVSPDHPRRRDLRAAGVDVVTFGQYLRPTDNHLAVVEYVRPELFDWYREQVRAPPPDSQGKRWPPRSRPWCGGR
eukprot:5934492-Prymnesium_polylepis.1